MSTFIRKLRTIGVSEFILIFVSVLAISGVFASSSVSLQQVIAPPPPPEITAILGDSQTRAVLVIGVSKLATAKIHVYAFSDPIYVETTSDSSGAFFAAFTADMLPPGTHHFTAVTILNDHQTTDPSPKISIAISDAYTVQAAPRNQVQTVKIANADPATSDLLRTIIRNQQSAHTARLEEIPGPNSQTQKSRMVLGGLFLIISIESAYLLWYRAKRKQTSGLPFFHVGRGFHRLPHAPNTKRQPA